MAIYPERKAHSLTGRYRIEVQLKGRRLRGRAGSLSEAKTVERELNSRLLTEAPALGTTGGIQKPSLPSTLQDGYDAADGVLWQGQQSEPSSFRKLSRIKAFLGPATLLNDFDANMVDRVVKDLKARDIKDSTVNRYLSCMSAFLTFCAKRGLKTNAVPEMEWRDEDEGRIRWITYEEEENLLTTLPATYAEVTYVLIRTGMRVNELLTLTKEQLEPRWAHLWGTGTKNGHSRSIPLNLDLYNRIKDLLSEMPDYWQMRVQWDKARKAMALEGDSTFVIHACRHTYATRSIQAGVNTVVLQKLMGHKSIQTTLRYAHVDDSTLSEAALGALQWHDVRGGRSGGAEGLSLAS